MVRMTRGQVSKIKVEVVNRKALEISEKNVSMELHHNQIPQRNGGVGYIIDLTCYHSCRGSMKQSINSGVFDQV